MVTYCEKALDVLQQVDTAIEKVVLGWRNHFGAVKFDSIRFVEFGAKLALNVPVMEPNERLRLKIVLA